MDVGSPIHATVGSPIQYMVISFNLITSNNIKSGTKFKLFVQHDKLSLYVMANTVLLKLRGIIVACIFHRISGFRHFEVLHDKNMYVCLYTSWRNNDVVFMWELRVSYVLISVFFFFFFCEGLVGQRWKIEGVGQLLQ